MAFAIKAGLVAPEASRFALPAQKTMYGGKKIAEGDLVFVFASENQGGPGLIARGVVTSSEAVPRKPGIARQTPRVGVVIRRDATAKRRLGRSDLRPFDAWNDGRPQTELNFKLYRQATNKIVGLSDEAAVFLDAFFQRVDSRAAARLVRRERPDGNPLKGREFVVPLMVPPCLPARPQRPPPPRDR